MKLQKILSSFNFRKQNKVDTDKPLQVNSSSTCYLDNSQKNFFDYNYNEAYNLQRKATSYKREGQLDLAIKCLEKSNEIMLLNPYNYLKKDYLRLVEFLKLDKQFEKARDVEKDLQKKLPKYFSGTLLENQQLNEIKGNLISFSGSSICPICSIYNQRTYSKQGKDKRFPSFSLFPDTLKVTNCPECGCYLGFGKGDDFDYKGSLAELIKNSNRPFVDMRTNEQKASYEKHKLEKAQQEKDKQDFDWLCEHLPEFAPKSFSGYRRMKNANSKNYLRIVEEALNNGRSI